MDLLFNNLISSTNLEMDSNYLQALRYEYLGVCDDDGDRDQVGKNENNCDFLKLRK